MPAYYNITMKHDGLLDIEIEYKHPQELNANGNRTIIAALAERILPLIPYVREPIVEQVLAMDYRDPFPIRAHGIPGCVIFYNVRDVLEVLVANKVNIKNLHCGGYDGPELNITCDTILKLKEVIACNTLRYISFSNIKFDSEEVVVALCQALRDNSSLEGIRIHAHNLSEKGVYAVATIASMQRITPWKDFCIERTGMSELSQAILTLVATGYNNVVAVETKLDKEIVKMLNKTITEYNAERERSKQLLWFQHYSVLPRTDKVKSNFIGYLFSMFAKTDNEKMTYEQSLAELAKDLPVLRRDVLKRIVSFLSPLPLAPKKFCTPAEVLETMKKGRHYPDGI